MADFSVNATQLSPSQGAGASPVAPVKTDPFDNGVGGLLGNIVNIFEKGLDLKQKEQSKAFETSIVNSYASRMGAINTAVETGQMKPSEASSRSRALHNEFVAGYAQFADKFEKVRETMVSGTTLGTIRDEERDARASFRKQVDAARAAGFPVPEDADQSTKQKFVDLHMENVRINDQLQAMYKRNDEARASGRYDREVINEDTKRQEIQLVASAASNSMEVSNITLTNLRNAVSAGKMTPEAAALEWASWNSKLDMQIQAAAANNPQLASGYRSSFEAIKKAGEDFFKPGADVARLDNKFKAIMLTTKLQLVSDPSYRTVVGVSETLGNNAAIALQGNVEAQKAVTRMLGLSKEKGANIIGNKEVESPTFKVVKNGLDQYYSGKVDQGKAKEELISATNNTLKQIAQSINNDGFKPSDLASAFDLVSSPSFGKFVKENPVDPSVNNLASQVFQQYYEKNVVDGINKKMVDTFTVVVNKADGTGPRGYSTTQEERQFDSKNVNISFNGGAIVFGYKKLPDDPNDRAFAMRKLEDFKPYQDAIGKLVRIGAHLSGETNYQKYWEDNKHVLLPNMFSKYQNLEIGQRVGDYIYIGGDANDERSYKPAK